jgi:hypothetical protein
MWTDRSGLPSVETSCSKPVGRMGSRTTNVFVPGRGTYQLEILSHGYGQMAAVARQGDTG